MDKRKLMRTTKKDDMDGKTIRRVHCVTALIASAAVAFYLFFQINKGGPFRDINPFGQDPYDAVG